MSGSSKWNLSLNNINQMLRFLAAGIQELSDCPRLQVVYTEFDERQFVSLIV